MGWAGFSVATAAAAFPLFGIVVVFAFAAGEDEDEDDDDDFLLGLLELARVARLLAIVAVDKTLRFSAAAAAAAV